MLYVSFSTFIHCERTTCVQNITHLEKKMELVFTVRVSY